jgi:hypothetical protein
MRRRFVVLLLAASAVAGGFAGLVSNAPSSQAATPGCQAAGSGLVCSSVDTPAGALDMDVWKRTAASDTPVKVWTESTTDPAEDWEMVPVVPTEASSYPALADKLAVVAGKTAYIEYAPGGVLSGYCISVITATAGADAALRPCDTPSVSNQTYNPYQTFVEAAAAADGPFFGLENVLTGLALTDKRSGGPGTAVVSLAVPSAGLASDQLWEPNG